MAALERQMLDWRDEQARVLLRAFDSELAHEPFTISSMEDARHHETRRISKHHPAPAQKFQ
ncbi:MAG TPA: hypothetical protein VIF88_13995 [Methylocystis sp.]